MEPEDKPKLQDDPTIKQWLDNLNGPKNTVKSYLQGMRFFIKYTKLNPEQLLEEAEKESQPNIPIRKRKIKEHLIGYRKYLQEMGNSDNTIHTRINSVISFYKSFDIEVPKLQSEKRSIREIEENNLVPTKEDLQDCLKVCDILERAVMLAEISSGLSSTEIRNVTVEQFRNGYDTETGITILKNITRQKTNIKFTTFFSVEATNAINEYLAYRDRPLKAVGVRRQGQVEKQRTTPKSPLFILRSVPDEYLETHDESLRQMGENAILKLYQNISEKARKNTNKNFYNIIRSHNMRKTFFNSLNGKIPYLDLEFLMGHRIPKTQAAYYRNDPESLKQEYVKNMPYLTIAKELDVESTQEYKNAIKRAEEAEAKADKAEAGKVIASVAFNELQELKKQISELQQAAAGTVKREQIFQKIFGLELGDINKYPGWQKDIEEHERRMKNQEYAKQYDEYKKSLEYEVFGAPYRAEYDNREAKEKAEKEELDNKVQEILKRI